MKQINNYIVEKLKITKDTSISDKEIEVGDKVLYFMIRDDVPETFSFIIDYCKIESINKKQNNIHLKSLTKDDSYSWSNLKKNSKEIYERSRFWPGKSTGFNFIILKDEDALDFLNTILKAEDYKKIDYTKWIDEDIHIPSKIQLNISIEDIQEIKYKIRHQND